MLVVVMSRILMCGPDAPTGGIAAHTKYITNELLKKNILVITYTISGSNFLKMYQRTVGLSIRAINLRKNIDIIHIQVSGSFFSLTSAITGVIISKIIRIPLIITYHNSIIKHKKILKLIVKNSTSFIVISKSFCEMIKKLYPVYSNKITVISNGFDDKIFFNMNKEKCRQFLCIPPSKKIIVVVGNLLIEKGYYYLINAIKLAERTDFICIIIGEGPLKDELTELIRENHLSNIILLMGSKNHNTIPYWINACDIFVLPSISEGNPTVMFEALGCGKPFVGTKVGGVPDIIISEEYGLLVEPADSTDLSNKIIIALNRIWDQRKILEYAKQYTWENVAKEIICLYDQVIKQN
jgi:glycosyltransferase involved in cell wall biosynthesis